MQRYEFEVDLNENCCCVMARSVSGEYVLYSEAQARIEALEWLVELQDLWLGSISWQSTWCDACVSDAGYKECRDIYLCARAAAGGVGREGRQ